MTSFEECGRVRWSASPDDIPNLGFPLKYGRFAKAQAFYRYTPAWEIIERAIQLLKLPRNDLRIDVHHQHLQAGGNPCFNMGWHYDCFNTPDDPRASQVAHVLYFAGAGCRTEFESGLAPEETLIRYGHVRHRATPATLNGYRVKIRVSHMPWMNL